jgi:hypothetical protein
MSCSERARGTAGNQDMFGWRWVKKANNDQHRDKDIGVIQGDKREDMTRHDDDDKTKNIKRNQ